MISNDERFWYIVFTIWCLKHGLDYKTEDFEKIKTISDEEYNECHIKATFAILKTWQCGGCWKKFNKSNARFAEDVTSGLWTMTCPHCKVHYSIDPANETATAEEG